MNVNRKGLDEAADDHVVGELGGLVDETVALDGEPVPEVEAEGGVAGAGPHDRGELGGAIGTPLR